MNRKLGWWNTLKNAKWSRVDRNRGGMACGKRLILRHVKILDILAKRNFLCVFTTIQGPVVLMVLKQWLRWDRIMKAGEIHEINRCAIDLFFFESWDLLDIALSWHSNAFPPVWTCLFYCSHVADFAQCSLVFLPF